MLFLFFAKISFITFLGLTLVPSVLAISKEALVEENDPFLDSFQDKGLLSLLSEVSLVSLPPPYKSRKIGSTTISSSSLSGLSFYLLEDNVANGVSHLEGSTLSAVNPYTPISSLMAWIFEEVTLKVGKSSNRFLSVETLLDLLVDSDLLVEGVLEEESKPRCEEIVWSRIWS